MMSGCHAEALDAEVVAEASDPAQMTSSETNSTPVFRSQISPHTLEVTVGRPETTPFVLHRFEEHRRHGSGP